MKSSHKAGVRSAAQAAKCLNTCSLHTLRRWCASSRHSSQPNSFQGALDPSAAVLYDVRRLRTPPSKFVIQLTTGQFGDYSYRGSKGCTALLENPVLCRLMHVAGLTPGLLSGEQQPDEAAGSRWRPWSNKARTALLRDAE